MINKDKRYAVKELWDLPYPVFQMYKDKSRTARYNFINTHLNPIRLKIKSKEMMSVKGESILKFLEEQALDTE